MVQREGRILRRGNENKNVEIYRYIAEGSFDAYAWQILENKQRFISQFLTGSTYQRSASDLENSVLTYAEVKALAISQPLMKQIAEKENECNEYRILRMKELEKSKVLKEKLNNCMKNINTALNRVSTAYSLNSFLESDLLRYGFSRIDSHCFEKDKFSKEFLFQSDKLFIQSFVEFDIYLPEKQDEKKPYIIIKGKGYEYVNEYKLEMGTSSTGNVTRLVNFFKGFDKIVKMEKEKLNAEEDKRTQIETQLALKSKYTELYETSKAELDALKLHAQLEANS